jgi:dihydrofolate synthase/folylpolyglutamate synthase
MPLDGVLEKLYARRRFGIRPGVDRVLLLLERLGHPEHNFRSIHVVGTNGKGSTSAYLASILSASGVRTALFTSPHLVSFTERFQINGIEISPERLEPLLASVLDAAPEEATFFEIVTALAALYFSEEQVTIAIMEAGMGGRSDATAALNGCMTIITPISLDHCDYLGTTLEQIAAEKCGIAEAGTPVIIGHQTADATNAISTCFKDNTTRPIWADRSAVADWNSDGTLHYCGIHAELNNLTAGIPGRYQLQNASLALLAAEAVGAVGISVSEKSLRTGISAARWPGRMEMIADAPALLLDGAHNPAGATALAEALGDISYRKLLLVLGVMADKDARDIVSALAPLTATCYCVKPSIERAMDDRDLAGILTSAGIPSLACGSVASGITCARRDATSDDLILVCGSLFTVGEAKAWLAGKSFVGIRG